MSLLRYEPVSILEEFNRMLNEGATNGRCGDRSSSATCRWIPAVDIQEKDNSYWIHMDLPGVNKEQVKIGMENNVLSISGQREETCDRNYKDYSRKERAIGAFHREFTLPDSADSDKIAAKMHQGVLEITIPKKQVAQKRSIEITESS